MKIEQIRTFLTIQQTGSFRAASEHLYKTQPAITKSIQALENTLGFALYDRTTHHPKLTDSGKTFYEAALHFYSQFERLAHLKDILKSNIEPEITISIDVCCPEALWAEVMGQCFEAFPETEFRIDMCTLNGGNESLLNGTSSIVICEHLHPDEPLETFPFAQIPLIPVASPDYIAVNDILLRDSERIWNTQQIILSDSARHEKKSFGIVDGHRRVVVDRIENKLALIKAGLGWGRMPDWMIEKSVAQGELIVLKYPHIATRYLPLSMIRQRSISHGKVNDYVWSKIQVDKRLSEITQS